jgi:alkylation response protein AidB-like acyl-CoA dehydrogenase
MRFALTDEQQMLRESVRGALTRELPLARVRECLERRDGGAAMRALAAAQGWTGIGIGEDAGGQGGGVVEQVVLAEELGYAAAPASAIIAGALAARVLAAGVDRAGRLLEELAQGTRAVVVAIDGSRDDDGGAGAATVVAGRAHGAVAHVLAAPEADVAIVIDAAGAAHAVDARARGCAIRARQLVDPGRSIGDVDLDGAPAEALGGTGGTGDLAALGAVLVSAEAVGAAARLLEMTIEYVTQRQQFGVVIGSFQAIKHAAADMLVEIETARSAVYYAAWALGSGDAAAAGAVSMAKAYAAPAAASVADKALALHGAVGFTWEHDLHLFLKRTHTARALFGSAGAHRERVAADLDLTGTAGRSPVAVA